MLGPPLVKSEDVMGGIVRCNGGGIAGNSCTLTPAHHSHQSTTNLTPAHQWPTNLHSHVGATTCTRAPPTSPPPSPPRTRAPAPTSPKRSRAPAAVAHQHHWRGSQTWDQNLCQHQQCHRYQHQNHHCSQLAIATIVTIRTTTITTRAQTTKSRLKIHIITSVSRASK